jgi:signal peptidase I
VGIVAVVAAILCAQPFTGLGLWVLGRKRRFLAWLVPSLLAEVLLVVGVWAVLPRLVVVASVGLIVIAVGSIIDTLVARSSAAAPSTKRALVTVLVAFVCGRAALMGVKHWLVESFSIPTATMQPTLLIGDHVMVKKSVRDIRRGDMVVFRYPPEPTIHFIKRVVAMAGDTVEIRSNVVRVNGIAWPQTPLAQACPKGTDGQTSSDCQVLEERAFDHAYTIMLAGPYDSDSNPVTVPPGHVFVLGDNRHNSKDSRFWGFLPVQNLTGVPTVTFFSVSPDGDVRWDRIGHAL